MTNVILIVILLLIVAGAGFHLYKLKKRGERCIGCPYGKNCKGGCGCASSSDEAKKC